MDGFVLDVDAIRADRARAAALGARRGDVEALVAGAATEPLGDVELAALFLSPHASTDALLSLARARRVAMPPAIETFSPLYLTNECDGECKMCGMRGGNPELVRETADAATVRGQLAILHRRGLRGVALLTGEYRHGARRREMIERAAAALRAALDAGFVHVLINIGALEQEELGRLLDGVPRDGGGRVAPQLTMCTFQETYDPAAYARFMGDAADNPRADFRRRLTNFDRARAAGMWSANPGVLLGLNADVAFELLALLAHVRHLLAGGMRVYVSLPRLRRATGAAHRPGATDDALLRLAAILSFGEPRAHTVISTREPPAMQRLLVPVIDVLTPGSPGVAPYTGDGARFEVEASQFEVLDHRPIEAILGEYLDAGVTIACYEPTSCA